MAKILLVDDAETYLRMECEALGPFHEYLTARNGQEAVRVATEELPDLVLMDMSMPLMNGDEAIRHIRANEGSANVPIIVVTAEPAHEPLVRPLGIDDFVRKPFDPSDLAKRVARVLAAAQTSRAAILVRVGRHSLAIPLDYVREVVCMPVLSQLPGAPRHIRGLLNLRGEAIPVFDLMSRLAVRSSSALCDQLIVIAHQDGHTLGVCVDDADDVVSIERGAFRPSDPVVASTFGTLSRALVGAWRREESLVPILSPVRLLPESTLARLEGAMEGIGASA
jgi:twitching motility two-component system response regulator PilH